MTERPPDSFIRRYRRVLLLVVIAVVVALAWFSGPVEKPPPAPTREDIRGQQGQP